VAVTGDPFNPHQVKWTGPKIQRYWDFFASSPAHQDWYFSKQAGAALISLVDGIVPLRGRRVLDFGCGPGFLLEKLFARGIAAEGVDTSSATIDAARARVAGHPLFKGVQVIESFPSELATDSFDVVFFVETIEHLLEEELDSTLRELNRITRPSGHIVVSTNNDEDLATEQVICPDCGGIFHRAQHLTSWTPRSLSALMARFEFDPVAVRTLTFRPHSRLPILFDLAASLLGGKRINLVYVGEKRR
jgi:2-polyprenyl-3-methyl-5-hydroxy-6-metoxy-1,4-benzoquinol methylase